MKNGSFEDLQVSNNTTQNSWMIYGASDTYNAQNPNVTTKQNIPGWDQRALGLEYQGEIHNRLFGSAAQGFQYAEVDILGKNSLRQTVSTTAGHTYQIIFAYAPRRDMGAQSMAIYWNGVKVGTVSGTGASGQQIDWKYYNFTVTATGTSSELGFGMELGTNGGGNFIDSITLLDNCASSESTPTPNPSSTPAPSCSGPAANLVKNGSFEDLLVSNSVTQNKWMIYGANDTFNAQNPNVTTKQNIPGWDPRRPNLNYQIEVHNKLYGNAASGDQYAEIDIPGQQSLGQNLETKPGYQYTVKFSYAPRPDIANQLMYVYWNGIPIAGPSGAGTPGGPIQWQTHTYTVTANSSISRLDFASIIGHGSGNFLDDVSVTEICNSAASPTPLPSPSLTPTPTPSSSAADLYLGEYFDNSNLSGAPKVTKRIPDIVFDWSGSAPDAALPVDNFSVRWTKDQVFEAGNYEFTLTGDDGIRLFIDDQLVIDGWKDQAETTYKQVKNMTEGAHKIRVEFYDRGSVAVAKFAFQKTNQPGPSASPSTSPIPTPTQTPVPAGELIVFDDAIALGFGNWSWGSAVDFAINNPVYAGSKAISFISSTPWAGFKLHVDNPLDNKLFKKLSFALKASQSNQKYIVNLYNNSATTGVNLELSNYGGDPVKDDWKVYEIPISDFQLGDKTISDIVIQSYKDSAQPALFIDQIKFLK